MHLSIRARMLLAMNLLVAAVGLAVGAAGVRVATVGAERALLGEAAENAAKLIGDKRWPLDSDTLLRQVGQILGAQTASTAADGGPVIAASLPAAQREELSAALAQATRPDALRLGDTLYRLGSATVRRASPDPTRRTRRLYLLVPDRRVRAAQRRVAVPIALFTLAAVVVATVVGSWLAAGIARPVRHLADRMDRLADRPDPSAGGGDAEPAAGPAELVRLGRSFDDLLARLAAARRQVERSARLATLGRLAAAVAHELRNPLSGVKMNARVLADELGENTPEAETVRLILGEIDRMDLFLRELLAAASPDDRPAPDSAPPAGAAADLRAVARSVLALLAQRCRHAGVDVEADLPEGLPPAAVEAERVRQVLLNLLHNALDAMPHGGRLTVRLAETETGGIRAEVADTGSGVDVGEGADPFEPFLTTRPDGTGLGLYVCRRVVEGAGGSIGYRSTGTGATFRFELPRAEERVQ